MGFCTKPTAHRSRRREEPGGAGVRPGRHGRLGGTTTGTNRDSRRGAATAATGLYGVSRVLFFVGGVSGGLLPCVAGVAGVAGRLLLPCVGELSGSAGNSRPVDHHSQATGGSQPAHRPRTARPEAETSPGRLAAPEEVGEPAVDTKHPGSRHHDHRRHGCQGRRTATTYRTPSPAAAAAPTHGKEAGPLTGTSAMGLRAVPKTYRWSSRLPERRG
jgi:hypothetical protein